MPSTELHLTIPSTLLLAGFLAAAWMAPPPPGGVSSTAFDKRQTASSDDDEIDQAELERLTATIRAEIEEMRGQSYPRDVAVSVADAEKFLEYVNARLEKTTTPEELATEEEVAKLLGVIPGDMDYLATMMELLEDQVGGFYDPDSNSFCLMSTFTGDIARVILAHELTHALDDQLYDIDGTLESVEEDEKNSDALFAFHAVVEGSGTALMGRWTMVHMAELDPMELTKSGEASMDAMKEAPSYLWKPLLAVYVRGAAFLNRTTETLMSQMTLPPTADVARAFENPPRSSEQILHPEKYWNPETRDDPVVVKLEIGELPEGWSVVKEDTLGEFGLGLVTEPLDKRGGLANQFAVMGVRYTTPAAEGWGGDRFCVLARDDARILRGVTVWDTEADAREFADRLGELNEHLDQAARGTAGASGDFVYERADGSRVVRFRILSGVEGAEYEAVAGALGDDAGV